MTDTDTTITLTPLAVVLRDVLIGYGAEVLDIAQVARNDGEVVTLWVAPEYLAQPQARCQLMSKKLLRMGYKVGISWSGYPDEHYRCEVYR